MASTAVPRPRRFRLRPPSRHTLRLFAHYMLCGFAFTIMMMIALAGLYLAGSGLVEIGYFDHPISTIIGGVSLVFIGGWSAVKIMERPAPTR